jgi:hypothetical protein
MRTLADPDLSSATLRTRPAFVTLRVSALPEFTESNAITGREGRLLVGEVRPALMHSNTRAVAIFPQPFRRGYPLQLNQRDLPRNPPAGCSREIADDLRHRMRRKKASPSRRPYCRRTGRLSGPRKPKPCQRTLAGSGNVMLGKRSNSMGSRMSPTVRRDRCAPAQ